MLLIPEFYPVAPFEDSTADFANAQLLRERAADSGYLHFKALAPAPLLEDVRTLTCRLCHAYGWIEPNPQNLTTVRVRHGASLEGRGWDDRRFVQMQGEVYTSREFRRLALCDPVMQMLEIVFDEPAALAESNQCWVKLPGTPQHTTLPHQDTYYLPGCPRMWSVWYPLVDTPLPLGPLGVVPGSHKLIWPHVDPWTGIEVPRSIAWATQAVHPGDIVAYGAATVHCAWSNVSSHNVRLTLDVRYEPAATRNSILRPGTSGH
jgi:ectoine hydroxylase-related dioxygenase (phytanoyl-CoA dioxygenase family)